MVYVVGDNQSRDTSLSLYRYVCHHVVGTEKTIQTRRMLNIIRDNLCKSKVFTQITSGSGGKGLDMKGSDIDIMCVYKDVNVYEDMHSARVNATETCVGMKMENNKLGFTHLRLLRSKSNTILKMCTKVGNYLYLSSQLCKSNIIRMGCHADVVHGPCLSEKYGYFELEYTLHSR